MKCKFFVLTLVESVVALYKSLSDESINSWFKLCETFIAHIITRKKHLTTMVVRITQEDFATFIILTDTGNISLP